MSIFSCCGSKQKRRGNRGSQPPLATATPSAMATTSDEPPVPIFIVGAQSGLFMEFQPGSTNPVVINNRDGSDNQKWVVTYSGVAGYIYIQNVGQGEFLTVGSNEGDKAYLSPKTPNLDPNQLWIFREPGGTNPNFVITSVASGYALNVYYRSTTPDSFIHGYRRTNDSSQQWSFRQ